MAATSAEYLLPNFTNRPGNKATFLIDARNFLDAFSEDLGLATTAGDFVLIRGWHIGMVSGQYHPSTFAPPEGGVSISDPRPVSALQVGPVGNRKNLSDALKEKAENNVDVRVFGWVNPYGMSSNFSERTWFRGLAETNAFTIASILELRKDAPKLAPNACLDFNGHAGGATHVRLYLIGNATRAVGYTGGWDLFSPHIATQAHVDDGATWHDVMLRIEGPSVQDLYDYYRTMWNANLQRPGFGALYNGDKVPSVPKDATELVARALPLPHQPGEPPLGTITMQSVRTIPKENYASFACSRFPNPTSLTTNGVTELKEAWKHAISQADKYIYMEDQYFWSREIMGWINERMAQAPNLKVILLVSGRPDPDDPDFPTHQYRCESLNHSLLKNRAGGDAPDLEFASRARLFLRWGPAVPFPYTITVDPPVGNRQRVTISVTPRRFKGGRDFFVKQSPAAIRKDGVLYKVVASEAIPEEGSGTIVVTVELPGTQPLTQGAIQWVVRFGITCHAKTTLIDDRWAFIGSPNVCRRSLYSDWEHSIGLIDTSETFVKQYRKELWNEHFGHSNPEDFENLDASLHSWDPTWGTADGHAPSIPPPSPNEPGIAFLENVPLPIADDKRISEDNEQYYNVFHDVDAREPWGSICDITRAAIGGPPI